MDVQGTTHTKIHVGTTGTGHATGIQINHAKGNAALQEWQLQTDASADGNLKIRNATSSTDVMFFDADNNNIGIKNTSPNNSLTVGDTVQPSYTPSSAGNYIEIARTSGADAGLLINKNTGQWLVGIDNSDGANAPLRFEYGAAGSAHPGFGAGTLGMIIKHSGHVLRPTMAAAAVTLSAGETT